MYAVVEIQGSQFKVEKDQKLFVNRIDAKEGSKISFDNVFLHLRGGSGWIKEMKGKLDNSVLEDCLKSLY